MDWSVDGRWLATGSGTGVILWDASGSGPRGRTPTVLEGHHGFVTTLAWQPQGPLLASGGGDGQVCLFAPTKRSAHRSRDEGAPLTIEPEATIQLDGEATRLAWTAGGGLLAAGDREGNVSIHRVSA